MHLHCSVLRLLCSVVKCVVVLLFFLPSRPPPIQLHTTVRSRGRHHQRSEALGKPKYGNGVEVCRNAVVDLKEVKVRHHKRY